MFFLPMDHHSIGFCQDLGLEKDREGLMADNEPIRPNKPKQGNPKNTLVLFHDRTAAEKGKIRNLLLSSYAFKICEDILKWRRCSRGEEGFGLIVVGFGRLLCISSTPVFVGSSIVFC